MTDKALAVRQQALMPVMELEQAITRHNYLVELAKTVMVEGKHYGTIQGTNKPTLYKPGAEMLSTVFGLAPQFEMLDKIENWNDTEPMFYYLVRCKLYHGSRLVGEADGSCNSREGRYRWRWVDEADVPPALDKATLKKRGGKISEYTFAVDKAETSGKYGKPEEYWQRFRNAIEAGTAVKIRKPTAKGAVYDAWEIDSTVYRVPNEDIFSQVNTILKMAEKRALVAAVLVTVNASEFFTQDMEDLIDAPTVTVINPDPVHTASKPINANRVTQRLNFDGAPMDADAYDDLREEQDAEKAIAELYGDEAGKNYEGRRVPSDIGHEADLAEAKRELGAGKDPTELVTPENHWLRDETTRKRFWAWVGQELSLDREQVHQALGVKSVYAFLGTKADAMEKLQEYAG